jgi:hypothetical protein
MKPRLGKHVRSQETRWHDLPHLRKFGQFPYYDIQLKHRDWKNSLILDFGGNAGNILSNSNSTIDPRNYWSVDVSEDGIKLGKQKLPEAHWIITIATIFASTLTYLQSSFTISQRTFRSDSGLNGVHAHRPEGDGPLGGGDAWPASA